MKTRLFTGLVAAGLVLAPLSAADKKPQPKKAQTEQTEQMDPDMQRAIAFERYKDLASARQAAMEAKHPTVFYNNADRSAEPDDFSSQGKKVIPKDPTGHQDR